MDTTRKDEIRQIVRDSYARVARQDMEDCGCAPTGCCDPKPDAAAISAALGYDPAQLATLPEGADMGLGCGNPQAIAALKPGETVVDLGSGGGIDCFLAARQVGERGAVIGVDMTPDMITKARSNAAQGGFENVEFRLGEIENLPVADDTADAIISNCVINLSPDKQRVFDEAFRILKPGGRLAVSDVVLTAELPGDMKNDPALLAGCVSGAVTVEELTAMLENAGFTDVRIAPKDDSRGFIKDWAPHRKAEDYICSAAIGGVKP